MRWLPFMLGMGLLVVSASCEDTEVAPQPEIEPWTLDNYCDRSASKFCGAIADCCQASDFGFEEQACKAYYERHHCQPKIDAVREDRVIFTPSRYSPAAATALIDECFAWLAELADQCEAAPGGEHLARMRERNQRCHIFLGKSRQQEPCEETGDCAFGFGDSHPFCSDNVCVPAFQQFPAGLPCPSYASICVEGYHCGFDEDRGERICLPDLELGAPCVAHPDTPSCGQDAWCDPIDGICIPSDGNAGDSCALSDFFQCRSRSCVRDLRHCAHPVRWFDTFPDRDVSLNRDMCGGRAE